MKKLGLDPAQIKYVIVSHGHGDHSGGAKYLQDKYGAHVILSAADWDLLDRSSRTAAEAEARHGGDRRDEADARRHDADAVHHARSHARDDLDADPGEGSRAAAPGRRVGRHGVQLGDGSGNYITPERPRSSGSRPTRSRPSASATSPRKAGADVVIANHTNFDGTKTKMPALAQRTASQKNPYVIGKEGVLQYLTAVDECAQGRSWRCRH